MTMLDGPPTTQASPEPSDRPGRRPALVLGAAIGGLLLVTLVVIAVLANGFGTDLRERGALLPGTVIAGVDVSLLTADEAISRVDEALTAALDHEVGVVADGRPATVSARALDATTDTAAAVAAALERVDAVTLFELARLRLLGPSTAVTSDAGLVLDDAAVAAFVAELATTTDRDPTDARLTMIDGELIPSPAVAGVSIDRPAAVEVLRDAVIAGAADPIALPETVIPPSIDDATIRSARRLATDARERALTRTVTLRHEAGSWETTAGELGGEVDGEQLVTEAIAAARADGDAIVAAVQLPEGALTPVLDEIAQAVAVSTVNASVAWDGGRVVRTAGQSGRALDREPVADALRTALASETAAAEVEVTTVATQPGRTLDAVNDVLVVHQSRRTVELHRGDQVVRSWPVAVGTGGSPTPTGTFTVGAKRFEPTWVNPALDRWGADMPERIGPGPDNPLGARALNWNRLDGGDTLIRFHGTPNEASIGSASSNGCVRMFNSDVIELYDMVRTGTMIISLA